MVKRERRLRRDDRGRQQVTARLSRRCADAISKLGTVEREYFLTIFHTRQGTLACLSHFFTYPHTHPPTIYYFLPQLPPTPVPLTYRLRVPVAKQALA